jgi:hypothetical protein
MPESPWADRYSEAINYLAARDRDTIESHFLPIADSGDAIFGPMAAYNLGLARISFGDVAGALEMLVYAFHSNHPFASAHAAFPYGLLLAQARRFDDAVDPLATAARGTEVREAAALLLARVHLSRECISDAIASVAVARQAAESRRDAGASASSHPVDPGDWFKAALGFNERGASLPAANCFEEAALSRDPNLALAAANNAGALYEALHNHPLAASMRALALELDRT